MQKSYELLNIVITEFDKKDLRRILERINSRIVISNIITLNLDHLRIASENMVYNQICKNASLVLIDGIGIASLLRIKYKKRFTRITGNDILLYLFSIAAEDQSRITIIGGNQKYKDKLFDRIISNYPSLHDKLQILTPKLNFDLDENLNSAIVEEVINFNPEILIAALGCPRQEIWIDKHKKMIGAKINIGSTEKKSKNVSKIGNRVVVADGIKPDKTF